MKSLKKYLRDRGKKRKEKWRAANSWRFVTRFPDGTFKAGHIAPEWYSAPYPKTRKQYRNEQKRLRMLLVNEYATEDKNLVIQRMDENDRYMAHKRNGHILVLTWIILLVSAASILVTILVRQRF